LLFRRRLLHSCPNLVTLRFILMLADDAEDKEWQAAAYEQFMREDNPEDSVYDKYA
jgi:hypothetical protein